MTTRNFFSFLKNNKSLKSVSRRKNTNRTRSKSVISKKKNKNMEGTPEEWKHLEVIDEEDTPAEWRGMEVSASKSRKLKKSLSRAVSLKKTPLTEDTDSCKLMEIPNKNLACWSGTDFFVSSVLKEYIIGKTLTYDLSKYESNKKTMSCEKIREIINNLNNYKNCKTIQSIEKIVILGNVFDNKFLSMLEKIFKILPNIKYLQIGLSSSFIKSEKLIESFAKKNLILVIDMNKLIVKRK